MNLAHDKKLHVAVGAAIVLIGFAFGHLTIGFVLAIAAGLAKEIYDLAHPKTHTADVFDFVATVSGGGITYLTILLIQAIT